MALLVQIFNQAFLIIIILFIHPPMTNRVASTLTSVRHVTGNDKDYLRKSPEWFGRNPRLTKGHYRCTANLCYQVKLEV